MSKCGNCPMNDECGMVKAIEEHDKRKELMDCQRNQKNRFQNYFNCFHGKILRSIFFQRYARKDPQVSFILGAYMVEL